MRLQTVSFGILALALAGVGPSARIGASTGDKAADVLAQARKAIGGGKLDSLKTFSAEAKTQRNLGTFQMSADLELLLAMPDKYMRMDSSSGGPASRISSSGTRAIPIRSPAACRSRCCRRANTCCRQTS